MSDTIERLAVAIYRAWAEDKNVPAWHQLPELRRIQWLRTARAARAEMASIGRERRQDQIAA